MSKHLLFSLLILLSACTGKAKHLQEELSSLGITCAPALTLTVDQQRVTETSFKNSPWECTQQWKSLGAEAAECCYTFTYTADSASNSLVEAIIDFSKWSPKEYLIMPGAVYAGNRFKTLRKRYPPLFTAEEYDPHAPTTITNIPRLNIEAGLSRIELNSGDMTTPAVGIWMPEVGRGLWILGEQSAGMGNTGFIFEENDDRTSARLTLQAVCLRDSAYRAMRLIPSSDSLPQWKKGDKLTLRLQFHLSQADSPIALNRAFLPIRKNYGERSRVEQLPFSSAFTLVENSYNTHNWDPKRRYYTMGDCSSYASDWQLGWVGGCMATLPLSLCGDSLSVNRSALNYERILTESQAPTGFFYGCGNGTEWCSDCFSMPHPDNLVMSRKNADALYFFYKYAMALKNRQPSQTLPAAWHTPMQRLAKAFVTLWDTEHQFGQFLDITTGKVTVGETSSAVMAIGGLALAGQYEHDSTLLRVAREAGEYYYRHYLQQGLTNGGPGEILQDPDSESAFAFLESYVALYEVTGEKKWLNYAEDAAALAATWTVSYDYLFPPTSTFGRLDMKTNGSVWANAQNKHSAPGICTLSGDALLKLYRATGNTLYKDLLEEIAHNLMQYISRKDRPIKEQLPGWVNERVNLSDWEGKDRVGEIFRGSTWADVSVLLTATEVPSIYVEPQKHQVTVFDHLNASLQGDQLQITNPTQFDAKVRVFIEKDPAKPYAEGTVAALVPVALKAGETRTFSIQGGTLK